MEKELNYRFKRRSKSYMEWLYEVIKSEYYFQSESIRVSSDLNSGIK
jgi:hypothetical protein